MIAAAATAEKSAHVILRCITQSKTIATPMNGSLIVRPILSRQRHYRVVQLKWSQLTFECIGKIQWLWLFRPFAGSPPGLFDHCVWLIHPLACSPPGWFPPPLNIPVIHYWGMFQFTERQQTSVASCHWLIVTSINVLTNWITSDHSS